MIKKSIIVIQEDNLMYQPKIFIHPIASKETKPVKSRRTEAIAEDAYGSRAPGGDKQEGFGPHPRLLGTNWNFNKWRFCSRPLVISQLMH